jgi:hypothetical protein
MGVTILYRGSLADLSRVEDFEDRVVDLALAIGGNPQLKRSALLLLRSEKIIDEEEFHQFIDEADAISAQITDWLRTIRAAS